MYSIANIECTMIPVVLRSGKLDLLLRISHFLDLHAGGWLLFASKCCTQALWPLKVGVSLLGRR